MKDFFIAFSASSAAMAGIIFAFLITKALGFESLQEDIMDEINRKILDFKRINSKILNRVISNEVIETRKEDIKYFYSKNLNEDYDKWNNKAEEFLMDYLLKVKIYYLNIDEQLEELKKISKNYLKNEYEKMEKYIEEMPNYKFSEILSLEYLKDEEEFKFLYKISQEEYNQLEKLFEYKKNHPRNFLEEYARGISAQPQYYPTPNYESEAKEIEKDIALELIEYEYKNEEINNLYKKINKLEKERKNLIVFLCFAYLIIIVGVIYPLSYVKYESKDILDYSFKNFGRELFSGSGLMLAILWSILTLFTLKIYVAIRLKIELHVLATNINQMTQIKLENYIIKNMERCQNFKKIKKQI